MRAAQYAVALVICLLLFTAGALAVSYFRGDSPSARVEAARLQAEADTLAAEAARLRGIVDVQDDALEMERETAAMHADRAARADRAYRTEAAEARRLGELADAALDMVARADVASASRPESGAPEASASSTESADSSPSVQVRPPTETGSASANQVTEALTLCTSARLACAASLDSADVALERKDVALMRARSALTLASVQIDTLHALSAAQGRALDTQRQAAVLAAEVARSEGGRADRAERHTRLVAGAGLVAVILSLLSR